MSKRPYNLKNSTLQTLTETETENPELVFQSFFDNFTMKDTREQLQEALKLVIKKRFRYRMYSIEEDDVRFFFEKLEKMVEAAWLMK